MTPYFSLIGPVVGFTVSISHWSRGSSMHFSNRLLVLKTTGRPFLSVDLSLVQLFLVLFSYWSGDSSCLSIIGPNLSG